MKTSGISKEDVLSVAKVLNKDLSNEEISIILQQYDEEAPSRPNDNWSEIIEDIIYNVKS